LVVTSPFDSEAFLQQLLGKAVAARASDVHLKVGQPPGARINGDVVYFRADRLTEQDGAAIARHLVAHSATKIDLAQLLELDTSYFAEGIGRFRVSVYRQRGTLGAVMRVIPSKIPLFEELGVPAVAKDLCEKTRGLVLVVGAAGNGKSSTLASMVGHLNRTQSLHIITIEDPIEFLHTDDHSSISQREVGLDTKTFAGALRAALRQDPDVIMLGEIRDEETLEITLMAAETGHLVLSTLHTPDVFRTVNRILSLSQSEPKEIRDRLGDALQGVIAQRLLPKKDGSGLVLAAEVLVASGTVREAIKRPEGNPPLKDLVEKGTHPYGMQTFEMHMRLLFQQGLIDRDVAKAAIGF
jgi:twitching motility protein PilT